VQALLAFVGVVAAGALIKSGIRWFFRERPKHTAPVEPTSPNKVRDKGPDKSRDKGRNKSRK
jgi:hypothetical protein